MRPCIIGLGSNLGDSAAIFAEGAKQLAAIPGVKIRAASSLYASQPAGGPRNQKEFLNAALLLDADLPPEKLLDALLKIELQLGRERTMQWGPRTLDLDLLLAGDEIISSERLTIPHPRMMVRQFAVVPAAEIAPEMIVPGLGWSLAGLRDHFQASSNCVGLVAADSAFRDEWQSELKSQLKGWKFEKVRPADFQPGVKNFLPRFVAIAQEDSRAPTSPDFGLREMAGALPPLQEFQQFLLNRSKRLTAPRRALVEFILSGDKHFVADDLLARLADRAEHQTLSRPTVYRTLNELVDAGLLRQLDLGGPAVYELLSAARMRMPWVVVPAASVEAAAAEVVAHCIASDTILECLAGPDWLPQARGA